MGSIEVEIQYVPGQFGQAGGVQTALGEGSGGQLAEESVGVDVDRRSRRRA